MTRRFGGAVLKAGIAVRAYAAPTREKPKPRSYDAARLALVVDTETRTGQAQPLLFGSYQIREVGGRLRQEGLIHGDVTTEEMAILERYVDDHAAANDGRLRLHSRRSFLRGVVWPIAYKSRARVVGFNLPFDLSRLAYDWGRSRDGGFRLELFESVDADGRVWPDRYRPAVRIKTISSKQQFISFVAPADLDDYLRQDGHVYSGRFLDLHMLAYALTDKSLSLERAAGEFGLDVGKGRVEEHGVLTPEYVDYNRQDVEVTWALHQALVAEWERHPIPLEPEQGCSAAAVGKAYLAAAGIRPPAERSDV